MWMIAPYGRLRLSRSLVERLFTHGVCNAACGSTRISPVHVEAPVVPKPLGFQRSVANVRFWHKADIAKRTTNSRLPVSGAIEMTSNHQQDCRRRETRGHR